MKIFVSLMCLLFITACKAESKSTKDAIVLTKNQTIVLNQEVDSMIVAKVLEEARKLDSILDSDEEIILVLDTPGGSITAGQELISGLSSLGRPVHTLTIFAASMGFQIVQGLSKRFILNNGELMSHRAFGGFKAEFGGKEPSQLTNRYNSWLEKIKQMDLQTVKRTKGKQTLESYQDAYENELWISGNAAVKAGYSDLVVKAKCDNTFNQNKTQEFQFLGIVITVVFSDCPLVTGPIEVLMKITTNKGTSMSLKEFQQKGGHFGVACAVAPDLLCPANISLTLEKIEQEKKQIINNFKKENREIKYNMGVL